MAVDLDRAPLDEARIEAFAGRMFGTYTAAMLTYMVDLGHRTGLFETLAAGPGTSEQVANRAGLTERYVREWLGAVTTGGIVEYDQVTRMFTLPPEHAVCLTGSGSLNVAPISQMPTLLAQYVGHVANAFRDGGGVPYEMYRPAFTDVMDAANRGSFEVSSSLASFRSLEICPSIWRTDPGSGRRLRHGPCAQPDGAGLPGVRVRRVRLQ